MGIIGESVLCPTMVSRAGEIFLVKQANQRKMVVATR